MRGYTRPPKTTSFRDRKFAEAASKEIFNRTLFFTDTTVVNAALSTTTLFSYTIQPRMFTGNGESIHGIFGGAFAANANAKALTLRLTDAYGNNNLWGFTSSSATVLNWILELDLFSQRRSTYNFGANVKFFNEDTTLPVTLRAYNGSGTDFTTGVELQLLGTGVGLNDVRLLHAKGIFAPGP